MEKKLLLEGEIGKGVVGGLGGLPSAVGHDAELSVTGYRGAALDRHNGLGGAASGP